MPNVYDHIGARQGTNVPDHTISKYCLKYRKASLSESRPYLQACWQRSEKPVDEPQPVVEHVVAFQMKSGY